MHKRLNFIPLFFVFLFVMFTTVPAFSQISRALAPDELKSILRNDHPRIFFNVDSFPAVRTMALGKESKRFEDMKARVDRLDPGSLESKDYGVPAAEAAFVYLVTDDERYRILARELLKRSIVYYHECYVNQKPVDWYAYSRICAWAAYDWIFNSLTRE